MDVVALLARGYTRRQIRDLLDLVVDKPAKKPARKPAKKPEPDAAVGDVEQA